MGDPGTFAAPIDYDRVADVYDLYVTSGLDIGFYVEEAGKAQGKVIELMCGTGRVSLPLLEAGVNLTCVDASEGMLARLEERLRAKKLEAPVLRADVRHLHLDQEEFDLALIPFHSFSELVSPHDQALTLRAVHGCLEEGGRLICPLHNPAVRARTADGALRLNGSFPTKDGGLLVVSGFENLEEGSGVVDRIQLYEFFDASNNLVAKRVLPMRFALIDKSGFAELADTTGFVPVALYGTYDYELAHVWLRHFVPFLVAVEIHGQSDSRAWRLVRLWPRSASWGRRGRE
jgi:SAM-dependent methyltransferase